MELAALPEPQFILISNRPEQLAQALARVIGPEALGFSHVTNLKRDSPGSCKIYLQDPVPGAMGLDSTCMTPREIADELVRYMQAEANYPPKTRSDAVRAWQIEFAMVDDKPAAIATTTWM